MKAKFTSWLLLSTLFLCASGISGNCQNAQQQLRIDAIKNEPGLIAFWDFYRQNTHAGLTVWDSYYDPALPTAKTYPLYLRRSDDGALYGLNNWPGAYTALQYDNTGPFGRGIYFNKGYIFGEVPRGDFENALLNINGRKSFSMIVWIKFTSVNASRHGIAGIWDEGNWGKYSGTRQYAMFGGLLTGTKGTLFHISATGAASFPQSNASGSQFARLRSINARDVNDDEWHALGVTFDHTTNTLTSYLDGVATNTYFNDPVTQDVHKFATNIKANSLDYKWPIFDPRAFVLKFTGYNLTTEHERWVYVDLKNLKATYGHIIDDPVAAAADYKVCLRAKRGATSLFPGDSLIFYVNHSIGSASIPNVGLQNGDTIETYLYKKDLSGNYTIQIEEAGNRPYRVLSDGAPFVIGRALGSSLGDLNSGSTAYYDGVAVFDRALSRQKMADFSFIDIPSNYYITNVRGVSQTPSGVGYAQEIEVTYSGNSIPPGSQIRFIYNAQSVTVAATGSPQRVTLTNIPFFTGSFTAFENVSVQLLNSSNSVLTQWQGKRFFPAPRNAGSLLATLAIENLEKFTGELVGGNKANLNWKVLLTKKVQKFELEKSYNGIDFSLVSSIRPLQNQTVYRWTDYQVVEGSNFYRLRLIDSNGISHFSPIIRLQHNGTPLGVHLKVSPTFFNETTTSLQLNSSETGKLKLQIMSTSGRSINILEKNYSGGQMAFHFIGGLNKGIYVLTGTVNGKRVRAVPLTVQ